MLLVISYVLHYGVNPFHFCFMVLEGWSHSVQADTVMVPQNALWLRPATFLHNNHSPLSPLTISGIQKEKPLSFKQLQEHSPEMEGAVWAPETQSLCCQAFLDVLWWSMGFIWILALAENLTNKQEGPGGWGGGGKSGRYFITSWELQPTLSHSILQCLLIKVAGCYEEIVCIMSLCLLKTQLKDHLEVHQYKYSMLDRNQNCIYYMPVSLTLLIKSNLK